VPAPKSPPTKEELLALRAAIRSCTLAAAPTDPTIAIRLDDLRPALTRWIPGGEPGRHYPQGLAPLWALLAGGDARCSRRYLSGEWRCTKDCRLAPPGWTAAKRERGGRPRKVVEVPAGESAGC